MLRVVEDILSAAPLDNDPAVHDHECLGELPNARQVITGGGASLTVASSLAAYRWAGLP